MRVRRLNETPAEPSAEHCYVSLVRFTAPRSERSPRYSGSPEECPDTSSQTTRPTCRTERTGPSRPGSRPRRVVFAFGYDVWAGVLLAAAGACVVVDGATRSETARRTRTHELASGETVPCSTCWCCPGCTGHARTGVDPGLWKTRPPATSQSHGSTLHSPTYRRRAGRRRRGEIPRQATEIR